MSRRVKTGIPPLASENSSQKPRRKRRQGGPGRPFPKGQIPPGARPFPPGVSGNPGGRPKDLAGWREGCRDLAPGILRVLDLVARGETKAKPGQVEAAKALLEHAWGKPKQPVEHSGGDAPFGVEIRSAAEVVEALQRMIPAGASTADERKDG